jgi:hypothetical protein
MTPEPRHCAYSGCRRLLVRRPGERVDKFARRRTCSTACAALFGRYDRRGLVVAEHRPAAVAEPPWPARDEAAAQPDFSAHNLRFRR